VFACDGCYKTIFLNGDDLHRVKNYNQNTEGCAKTFPKMDAYCFLSSMVLDPSIFRSGKAIRLDTLPPNLPVAMSVTRYLKYDTAKPTVLTAKPNLAQGLLEILWFNLFCRTHTNQAINGSAKPTPQNIIIKYSVYKNKLIKHKHLTIQNTDTPTKVTVLDFVCFVALCLFLFRCCVFVYVVSLLVLDFLDVGFFV